MIEYVIEKTFGNKVLDMVKELSDTVVKPKPPWRERKETYIEHLGNISDEALLVSVCDKLHNLTTIVVDYHGVGDRVFERFAGKKEGTLWYYRTIVEKYKQTQEASKKFLIKHS